MGANVEGRSEEREANERLTRDHKDKITTTILIIIISSVAAVWWTKPKNQGEASNQIPNITLVNSSQTWGIASAIVDNVAIKIPTMSISLETTESNL